MAPETGWTRGVHPDAPETTDGRRVPQVKGGGAHRAARATRCCAAQSARAMWRRGVLARAERGACTTRPIALA